MKTCVIVNAHSGRGKAESRFLKVKSQLEKLYGHIEIIKDLPLDGHASIINLLEHGVRRFIVIGGDGTIHRLVNVLTPLLLGKCRNCAPIELGVIGAGTGRDFSRNLKNHLNLKAELQALSSGHTSGLDVAEAQVVQNNLTKQIYFINSLSVGIGSEALSLMRNWHKKYLPPFLSYLVPGLQAFLSFNPRPLLINYVPLRSDAALQIETSKNLGVMICNGQFSGGGMQWSKTARIDDSLLQLVVLPEIRSHQVLPAISKLATNQLEKVAGYSDISCKEISIALKHNQAGTPPLKIEIDGELYSGSSVTVRTIQSLFRVIG